MGVGVTPRLQMLLGHAVFLELFNIKVEVDDAGHALECPPAACPPLLIQPHSCGPASKARRSCLMAQELTGSWAWSHIKTDIHIYIHTQLHV